MYENKDILFYPNDQHLVMNWIRQWGRRPDRPLKTQMSSAGELRTYGNPLVDTRGERGRQDEERVGCGVCWSSRQVLSEQEGCSQDCHGSKNYCSLLKTAGCPLSNCPKPWSCSWVIGRWSGRQDRQFGTVCGYAIPNHCVEERAQPSGRQIHLSFYHLLMLWPSYVVLSSG